LMEFATTSQQDCHSPHLLVEEEDDDDVAVCVEDTATAVVEVARPLEADLLAELLEEDIPEILVPADASSVAVTSALPRKEAAVGVAAATTTDCYSSDDDLVFRPVASKRGKKKGGNNKNNRSMEESVTDFEGWKVWLGFSFL
jgi:hypothetical protein